jgi:uncharacterized protein YggU (UPF0235/DUF167 family)
MTEKIYIQVRVTTKARTESIECRNKKYFVTVKEKAERGVANARVKQLLAHELQCNPQNLRLVKGGTTPSKTYLLSNV